MAGRFKYANPELLTSPYPGETQPQAVTDPIRKAMEMGGPAPGNTLPSPDTVAEGMSNIAHVQRLADLPSLIAQEQMIAGRSPEEMAQEMNRDDRGMLGKAFDYISKPFRYETSVMTSPVVAAMEAMRTAEFGDWINQFMQIYPELQKQALTGEREVSVYDALRRMGMSNWGAIPLGIGADILLSPSTYLGIGGPTKLGKLAKASTLSARAGEVIDPASKVGAQIAKLAGRVGAENVDELLRLAPTLSGQAELGQRALVKFMGKPIIEGAPVFRGLEGVGDLIRSSPTASTVAQGLSSSFRPAGVEPQAWQDFLNLKRIRQSKAGIRTKDMLTELEDLAKTQGLTPDELEEVFYAMSKSGENMPWEKLTFGEAGAPTTLSALRAKYPGLYPNVKSVSEAEFKAAAKKYGVKPAGDSFTVGKLGEETTTFIKKDIELSKLSQEAWEASLQGIEEGKNVFSVLPEASLKRLKKVYGITETTPELAERFGKDWEKFLSGNDAFLDPKFRKWVTNLTEKEGGHLLVDGVKDVTMPDGTIRRIVGDVRFVNDAQEAVRVFAKEQFQKLIQEEQALGILNHAVEDYVPGIYRFKASTFRGGKEFSTEAAFKHEKAFRTPAEAEAHGYEPVKNILELVGIRSHASYKVQATTEMLDEAAKLFGIPAKEPMKMANHDWSKLGKMGIDPENYTQLTTYLRKEGYQPLAIGKKEYWFQPEIADALTKMIEPYTDEATSKLLLQNWDKLTNLWKGYVTSINPKFHMRNMISNNYLLYLKDGMQGLNPVRHKMAIDVLSGKPGQLLTETGKTISYDDLRRMIDEVGIKGTGFMGGELGSHFRSKLAEAIGQEVPKTLNPLSTKNVALEFGRKFGTGVENEAKVVGFINDLIKHGDPMEAAKNTYKYLYDYMDLTSFEKTYAKRLIPFWTWMSKNIPNMLTNLVQQPGKLGIPIGKIPMAFEHKTKAELRKAGINYPDEIVPPFIKEQGAFPIGLDKEGRVMNYVPGMPYQDLAKLSPQELMGGLHPAIKALTEYAPKGGYSIFMDRPYESYKGQLVEAPLGAGALPDFLKQMLGVRKEQYGTYMPGETAAIINTLLPMLRTPGKLVQAWEQPRDAKYILPSELLGQKVIPIDPAAERRATLQKWLQRLGEPRKAGKGLEAKESKKAAGREELPLTLEQLIQLQRLRYRR